MAKSRMRQQQGLALKVHQIGYRSHPMVTVAVMSSVWKPDRKHLSRLMLELVVKWCHLDLRFQLLAKASRLA